MIRQHCCHNKANLPFNFEDLDLDVQLLVLENIDLDGPSESESLVMFVKGNMNVEKIHFEFEERDDKYFRRHVEEM